MSKDHYARHHQVRQVLATYSEAVASVPALARLAQQYHQRLAQLSRALPTPSADEAVAPDQPASALLLAQLAKAAGALYLLYKSVGALGLALGLPQGARAYRRLDAPLLAAAATALSQQLAANAGALAEYNITAADVQSLAAAAAALSSRLALPAPTPPPVPALLGELNRFLKGDLGASILLLKDAQPAAYRALRAASQLPDPAHHQRRADRAHRALKRTHLLGLLPEHPVA